MDDERRYGDREVESLIARAVELSREAEAAPRPRGGLRLEEVERIAVEAGLSAQSIRRAAQDLEAEARAPAGGLRRFFGAERLVADLVLPGHPGEGTIQAVLAVLPDLCDASGSGTALAGGLVWRADGGYEARTGSKLRVELSREGNRSRLRIERSFDGAAGGIYGGLVGGLGLGCGLGVGLGVGFGELHSALFAISFSLASLGLSWLAARGIMGLYAKDARRRNRGLMDNLASRLAPQEEGASVLDVDPGHPGVDH